jgi:hypothetical protein
MRRTRRDQPSAAATRGRRLLFLARCWSPRLCTLCDRMDDAGQGKVPSHAHSRGTGGRTRRTREASARATEERRACLIRSGGRGRVGCLSISARAAARPRGCAVRTPLRPTPHGHTRCRRSSARALSRSETQPAKRVHRRSAGASQIRSRARRPSQRACTCLACSTQRSPALELCAALWGALGPRGDERREGEIADRHTQTRAAACTLHLHLSLSHMR